MAFLPLPPFVLACIFMVTMGFREKAKYRAAHPEEFPDTKKKA